MSKISVKLREKPMLKENFPTTKMYILAFLENGKTYLRVPRSSPRGAEGGLLFHTVFCRVPRTESCLMLTFLHCIPNCLGV